MKSLYEDDYMEAINLNKKGDIINAYGLTPTLPYDIEGTLVEKEGKNIKVEKTIENKKVSYSLKLKEEITSQLGEMVKIDKKNILSVKTEEIDEEKEEEKPINTEEVIKRLGLEDTEETKKGVEHLINNQIPITRENLDSFFMSKKYLNEIVENMDFDSCIKLLDKGIDLKEDSLQKIAEALSKVKEEGKDLSLRELLKLNRKLTYKEAETIAKDIYGRSMGKDVYDSIIALHKERIPINKENIEKIMEVKDKLYDLKDYEDEAFIKAMKEDLPFNIEILYKLKHSYNSGNIEKNITSSIYEKFTIEKEQSLEEILDTLKELGLEESEGNIKLLREFFINEVELTQKNFEKIIYMKDNLKEIIDLLDEENTALLLEEGVDPLKEDIANLIEKIKTREETQENISSDKTKDIMKNIEGLKAITDKDLLQLVKSGEDFKIENLKEIIDTNTQLNVGIDEKTVQKAMTISNIFNTLGELDSQTISFAVKRYNTITLNTLYDSYIEVNTVEEVVEPINKAEESFIKQEYLNARSNTTLNLVKTSVKEGIELEHMAIEELNEYIDKKVNKYREVQRLTNEMKHLQGKEDSLIPMVMKNGLDMSINQLNNINSLLNRSRGIGNVFDDFLKDGKHQQDRDVKEGIGVLENKIKEFSTSLREGKDKVKDDYKNLLDSFKDLNNSFNSNGRNNDEHMQKFEEYLSLQGKLSKDDLVLQLPIWGEDGYKNINLIIPNVKKGIDKNHMRFYLNMDMENLGEITFNIEVKGNEVYIDFQGNKGEKILDNKYILEDGLNRIGYKLEEINLNHGT